MIEVARAITPDEATVCRPIYAVWEITLACDLKCTHCGSRAGKRRPDELDTQECLDIIDALHRMGTKEVTLIGGEAYLRKDWTVLLAAIAERGMKATVQTGGRNLTEERIRDAAEAGVSLIGFSIDGLRDLHDELRGFEGSYDKALEAMRTCRKYGIDVTVNTQIGPRTIPELRPMLKEIAAAGAGSWRLGLTVAMGRAADNEELLLQPYQILDLMPLVSELIDEGQALGVLVGGDNSLGYFGPYESKIRGHNEDAYWHGCTAGLQTLGIEADGTIKACPSLPTSEYTGGNVRDASVQEIWRRAPELGFNRDRTREDLWGHCQTCYYADVCKAGCTWTTSTLLGRAGNNPYCHFRALALQEMGIRERIVKVEEASGLPFDHARFEIVEEPFDAPREPVKKKSPKLRVLQGVG
jgi:radical SAM protein with 4Fe4S-binding SPASM domain